MTSFAPTPSQAWHMIGGCWMIFCVFWLMAAISVKKATERWSAGTGFFYIITSVVTYNLLIRSDRLGRGFLGHPGPGSFLLAVILMVIGLAITLWARVVLGRNWSGSVTHKENHELVETGPYRFVRHPIYTGLLLMTVGTAMARGTWDAVLAIFLFTAVHIWKLRQEEALMTRYFPEAYPAYRARTKALLPLLY